MKKRMILWLMILALLLCGCQESSEPTEATEATEVPTAPVQSWVETSGTVWDKEGTLVEMPRDAAAGWSLNASTEYDGDLLVWSYDMHLEEGYILEMCLVELDTGTVVAQRDMMLESYLAPQTLGENLYLCDCIAGEVYQLDKNLQTVNQWDVEPVGYTWYMGGNEKLYQMTEESGMLVYDLVTNTSAPVLKDDPDVSMMISAGNALQLEYYHKDTGELIYAALDLATGKVVQPEAAEKYAYIVLAGDTWLSGRFDDGYVYYIGFGDQPPVMLDAGNSYFELLDNGYLLETNAEGGQLHLYDTQGKAISSCYLSENGTYSASQLIWNEMNQGYFILASGYDEGSRLLFWDTSAPSAREDLVFRSIPTPSEEEQMVLQRCEEIGAKYGLAVLTGDKCDTVFTDFSASIETDWEKVNNHLDILEEALGKYPEGFFRQLHYGETHGVQIQLVSGLLADGNGRSGDGYVAFVQSMWDHALMVVDIDDAITETYYHEFSHVIDKFLEWDSCQREDALYSDGNWEDLNPDGFEYSYDYSDQKPLDNYNWFVDPYSTVSPTEDRARVMEYAMCDYGSWTFNGASGLQRKLEFYCDCIRDAFDTTGWPEEVLWEQYLN